MRRLLRSRGGLFLLERGLSAGGGLLVTAIIVRGAAAESAAGYLAAFALASLFPPLFANACAPVAIRLWREVGRGGWAGFVAALFAGSSVAALALAAFGGPFGAAFALHVAASPAALAAAPFLAGDRFRALLAVLIPVGVLGLSLRALAAVATGDLMLVAALYAVEPVLGGVILTHRAGAFRRPRLCAEVRRALFKAAPPLMAAIAAATLFWRSPVLLADGFLGAEAVIALALAMQIVTGLSLPAQALAGSLMGPIAAGAPAAPGTAALIAIAAGVCAVILAAAAGDWALAAIYGPIAVGAAAHLVWLAPLAGLAAMWRLTQMSGGLSVDPRELAATRLVAPGGQALLMLALFWAPSAGLIAVATPISMAASALIAPFFAPSLRPLMRTALGGAARALSGGPEFGAALRLLFAAPLAQADRGASKVAPVSAKSSA